MRTLTLQSAVFFQRIEFSMQRTWNESCSHLKLAAITLFFQSKMCQKFVQGVSSGMLLTLKGFCMAKSAVDLDVNIALSKYGFNGVASFEIFRFGLWKRYF